MPRQRVNLNAISIRFKTVLLAVLVCVLAVMVVALSRPGMISADASALGSGVAVDPAVPAEAASATPGAAVAGRMAVRATAPPSAPAPAATEQAKASPTMDLEDQYYTDVEAVYISPEKDRWSYTSPTLGIEIAKITATAPAPLVYYVAEVHTKDPEALCCRFAGDDGSGRVRLLPAELAVKAKAVLAVTSDGFTAQRYQKGILIRGGEAISDKKRADTLAVIPDGSLRIVAPKEFTDEALLKLGVRDTFSYGPTLIRDCKPNAAISGLKLNARCARTGIGMVELGHFVFIVVDGVDKAASVGMTLEEFAALFQKYGCKQAYNLEGGAAAALCFMGKKLNGLPSQKNRDGLKMTDMICIGQSELVGMK